MSILQETWVSTIKNDAKHLVIIIIIINDYNDFSPK